MLETILEVFLDAVTSAARSIFTGTSSPSTQRKKMKAVAIMLKAIHVQESKEAAREKACQVAEKLQDGIEKTLTYMDFPTQHWSRIRTNNTIERLNCEIKRRTRAIGALPDGQSTLMLVCVRLRHVTGTQWAQDGT